MEASPEQRQKLLEGIWKRNAHRVESEMPALDITKCYANGLNRILKSNLDKQKSQTIRSAVQSVKPEHGVILRFKTPKPGVSER